MMGSMYNKIRSPSEVKALSFKEMKYWVTWNEAIDKGNTDAFNNAAES